MGCLCEQQAGKNMQVSVTCIGHLWVFENLKPEELGALTRAAWRKVYQRGQEVFSQGGRAKKMFLIKAGRVKFSKITKTATNLPWTSARPAIFWARICSWKIPTIP